jgi:hypothetical protein
MTHEVLMGLASQRDDELAGRARKYRSQPARTQAPATRRTTSIGGRRASARPIGLATQEACR